MAKRKFTTKRIAPPAKSYVKKFFTNQKKRNKRSTKR